jgi:hypothetical protein
MNRTHRVTAALAVLAGSLMGCGQQLGGPTAAAPGATTPSSSASSTLPEPASASPRSSDAEGGDLAAAVPGEFTVCIPRNRELRAGTNEQVAVPHPEGDMTVDRQRGYTWSGNHTATDPRFSGTHYYSWDADTYTLSSGDQGQLVYAEALRIENPEGAWQGEGGGVTLPDSTSANGPVVLTGEGAYEGLTAVLLGIDGTCFIDFRGIVMEFPDPPVPATTE